jgi:hypothetical protein
LAVISSFSPQMRKFYFIVECYDMTDDSAATLLDQAAIAATRLLADIQRDQLELANDPNEAMAPGVEALEAVAHATQLVLKAVQDQSLSKATSNH